MAYCWRRLKLGSLLPESVLSRSLRRKLDEHSSDSITLGSANQCVDWLRRFAENRLADLCGGRWCRGCGSRRDRELGMGRVWRAASSAVRLRPIAGFTVMATKTAMACRIAATSAREHLEACGSMPMVALHRCLRQWSKRRLWSGKKSSSFAMFTSSSTRPHSPFRQSGTRQNRHSPESRKSAPPN